MSAINSEVKEENKHKSGRCLLKNWVEESATELLDRSTISCINKHGHKGILTMDVTAKVQDVSTFKAAFKAPSGHGIRLKGRRMEVLENDLIKRISDQIHAELNADPPVPELCSVTKSDYKVEGFKSVCLPLNKDHEYTTDPAITFWSDNYQKIQGVTEVTTKDSPFKRNATFTTPVGEQLNQLDDSMLNSPQHDAHL